MNGFLLSVHVIAAILTVGPVAVAASMFPRSARLALEAPDDPTNRAAARILHRITRIYAVIAILVPLFGIATGASMGLLGDTWLIISMILTAAAAAVLIAFILPNQTRIIHVLDGGEASGLAPDKTARRLAMLTGVFNLLWAVVVVLMIYRPGSTTGAGL